MGFRIYGQKNQFLKQIIPDMDDDKGWFAAMMHKRSDPRRIERL